MRGRSLVAVAAVAVAVLTVGCSDDKPPAAGRTSTTGGVTDEPADASADVEPVDVAALEAEAKAAAGQVVARSRAFEPATVTIAPGQAVAWRFEDGQVPHGLVGDGFESSARTQGVVVHTFAKAGSYAYHCPVHPDEMQGTIEVR